MVPMLLGYNQQTPGLRTFAGVVLQMEACSVLVLVDITLPLRSRSRRCWPPQHWLSDVLRGSTVFAS
jgi:hypothetical protein